VTIVGDDTCSPMPSDGLDHSGSNDTLGRKETPLERCDLRRGRIADLAGKPSAPTPPTGRRSPRQAVT
jgi:hypothetical protein